MTVHLSLDFKIIFSPVRQSLSNIVEDFALLRSNFFLLNNFVIFSSLKIIFFEKPASEFSFKFNIDRSHLPLELKNYYFTCLFAFIINYFQLRLLATLLRLTNRHPLQNIFQPLVVKFSNLDFVYLS